MIVATLTLAAVVASGDPPTANAFTASGLTFTKVAESSIGGLGHRVVSQVFIAWAAAQQTALSVAVGIGAGSLHSHYARLQAFSGADDLTVYTAGVDYGMNTNSDGTGVITVSVSTTTQYVDSWVYGAGVFSKVSEGGGYFATGATTEVWATSNFFDQPNFFGGYYNTGPIASPGAYTLEWEEFGDTMEGWAIAAIEIPVSGSIEGSEPAPPVPGTIGQFDPCLRILNWF